jgi:hypothetical protein
MGNDEEGRIYHEWYNRDPTLAGAEFIVEL